MAELKIEGRKIAQPSAPDVGAAGQAFGNIGKIAQEAVKTVGDVNKAAAEMESAVLYTSTSHDLNKLTVLDSSPQNIAAGDAYQRHVATSNTYINNAIGLAPKGHAKALEVKLRAVANSNSLKILTHQQKYSFDESKAVVDVSVKTASKNYEQAVSVGDRVSAQEAKEEVEKLYNNGIELGIYNQKEKYEGLEALRQSDISSRYYKRGENDAIANPGEAEKQQVDFVRNFSDPDIKTESERRVAIAKYREGLLFANQGLQSQRAINASETSLDIVNGEISNPAQIYNRDLTVLQGKTAEIALWKEQHKKNNKIDKLSKFMDNVQQGAGIQNLNASEETKEDAFNLYKGMYLSKKRELTGESDIELTIKDEASILSQINVPIPSIDARLNYAMESSDLKNEPQLSEWALGLIRTVGDDKPNTISLSARSRAIANLANTSLLYGRTNVASAMEGARNTVDVDEAILVGRRSRQYKDGWENEMRAAYKDITNADPDTNPTSWGAFKSIYSSQAMLTDSKDAAKKGAKQVITPAFGKSIFFQDGEYGYLPPEKIVPFAEQERWLESQINLKLIDIAEANHNATEEQIPNLNKVEIGGDQLQALNMRKLAKSKEINEEDLYYFRVGPLKPGPAGSYTEEPITYRVDGQDRRVYLEAHTDARMKDGSKLSYSVYTIDPVNGTKDFVRDPRSKSSYAVVTIDPLSEFLPQLYKDNKNKLYDDSVKDVLLDKYRKRNKFPIIRAFGLHGYIKEHGQKTLEQLETNEKEYNKNDVIMENKKGTLLTKIDVLKEYENSKQ